MDAATAVKMPTYNNDTSPNNDTGTLDMDNTPFYRMKGLLNNDECRFLLHNTLLLLDERVASTWRQGQETPMNMRQCMEKNTRVYVTMQTVFNIPARLYRHHLHTA
jgi:hypothetical protein